MSFVKPEALEAIRGAALFYPVAGSDWPDALVCFAPSSRNSGLSTSTILRLDGPTRWRR
jgi:hypothetical protein